MVTAEYQNLGVDLVGRLGVVGCLGMRFPDLCRRPPTTQLRTQARQL